MFNINEDNILNTKSAKPSQNKPRKSKKDAQAKKFLCVMLALVIAFIGIVCVFVSVRNKKLIKESASSTSGTDAALVVPPVVHGTNPGDKTTLAPSTTKPITTIVSTTEAEKPSVTMGIDAQLEAINNPKIITISEDKWNLTIVNRSHRIPGDYNPDLVYVCGSGERLDRKIAPHYEKMYNAALKDGVTLTPCSGYRSYETQERIYNRKVDFFKGQGFSENEARVKAASVIMPPGSSEHNLGYAMDIVCVDEWFEDTKEFAWLKKNAADYGFIMRYPKEKQDVTKVIYEPWHWRYVGVENAKAIKASGLVMEEYYEVKA